MGNFREIGFSAFFQVRQAASSLSDLGATVFFAHFEPAAILA
jgi:hypothetical protein